MFCQYFSRNLIIIDDVKRAAAKHNSLKIGVNDVQGDSEQDKNAWACVRSL